MHIENLTVNIEINARPGFPANLLHDILKGAPPLNENTEGQAVQPPPIGSPWPGQGGIYAGVARGEDGQADHHLILSTATPDNKLDWSDAQAWAGALEAEGHRDFVVPSRSQSAVLYANVRDQIPSTEWHWTRTQSSSSNAFGQSFYYGGQTDYDKSYEGRVQAVRTIHLTT